MLTEKLEAVAASIVCFQFHVLMVTGTLIVIYLTFFTQYWYVPILYYIWACYIDKETPNLDGRTSQWVSCFPLYKYATNYFPIKLHFVPGVELDPKRSYLACIFPHAYVPLSVITAFTTNCFDIRKKLPNHKLEFGLALGFCPASAKTIGYHLGHPDGGRIVGLVVGGTSEMEYCHNGQYRLTLRNRKGFAKLALIHSAPLIPIFVFGETSILRQKVFSEGSIVRSVLDYLRKNLGYPCVAIYGRGLFQDKFGVIPLKNPINIVVGLPIEVTKVEKPNQEDIDVLHQKFIDKLTELFEKHKYQFEEDPTNCKLVIA